MASSTAKTFNSQIHIVGEFRSDWCTAQIKNEPMFFNSDLDFAYHEGGPITRAFIRALPKGWEKAVIDTRVHMLMPGWYPAIPGWHHDDVPRPIIGPGQHFITAGQPDYDNPRYHSEHIMGLVNGHICPTYFALGEITMPAIPEGELIYREWHKRVDMAVANEEVDTYEAESGKLIYFDWQTFHTGQKTKESGWRWFARISRNTDRQKNITNEIRNQVQVYMEFPMEGW